MSTPTIRVPQLSLTLLGLLAAFGCSASGTADGGGGPNGSSSGAGNGEAGSGGGDGVVFGNGGDGFGSGGSSSGVGGTSAFPGCNADVYTGERLPMDMYIMFDQSVSMSCAVPSGGDRWAAVRTAMEEFVRAPSATGLGVGIGYFGNVAVASGQPVSCDPAVYEVPDAEIAPLPGNAQAIVDSIARHGPSSTTPTPPALAGALNHAIAWRDGSGRPTIVVLVTDGQPNECGAFGVLPTPQDVADVAAAGLAGAGMQTYVVGIVGGGTPCDWDPNPPNVGDLDLVANAGGTNAAFIVDASQDVAAQFLDQMNQIRTSAQLPCEFVLPQDGTVDLNQVNLSYTGPDGSPQPLYYASDPSVCDAATGGWYYDDPNAPSRVILCPASCDVVKVQVGGLIEVVLGCPTEPIR